MQQKKYIVWLLAIVAIWGISWITVKALDIQAPVIGIPIFKQIFLKSNGDTTQTEGVRLDSNWMYIDPVQLPTTNGTLYKIDSNSEMTVETVKNADIDTNAVTTTKIMDNSIVNTNFADTTINNTDFQANTLQSTNFDPSIVWPTGWQIFYTNNVCSWYKAIRSVSNGTATCASLPTWSSSSLPSCSDWQVPVYSGSTWTCQTLLLWGGASDPYWTWSTGWDITNSNSANVGIGIQSPTAKLTVSWSLTILWLSEQEVYCNASDSWLPMSSYSTGSCAGCPSWYTFDAGSNTCEMSSCTNAVCGLAAGWSYATSWDVVTAGLCNVWNPTSVTAGMGGSLWRRTCQSTNSGSNTSCNANNSWWAGRWSWGSSQCKNDWSWSCKSPDTPVPYSCTIIQSVPQVVYEEFNCGSDLCHGQFGGCH